MTETSHNQNTLPIQKSNTAVKQIFRYLEALNQLRNPVKRVVEEDWVLWLKNLPIYPSIVRGDQDDDFLFKVTSVKTSEPPTPPIEIVSWLREGWQKIDGEVEVEEALTFQDSQDSSDVPVIERFEDNTRRIALLDKWSEKHALWSQTERLVREAKNLYERLYTIYGQLQRESESQEIVFGDGVLEWFRPEGRIHHPVLIQRLQLEFDPIKATFILRKTEHPVELNSALFGNFVDPHVTAGLRRDLENQEKIDPSEQVITSEYLRSMVTQLSAQGEFLEDQTTTGVRTSPTIRRDPVVYIRKRTLGFATAIESILGDVSNRVDLPSALLRLVGDFATPISSEDGTADTFDVNGNENPKVLFSKPANRQQQQIAERLDKHGCVLVQGRNVSVVFRQVAILRVF